MSDTWKANIQAIVRGETDPYALAIWDEENRSYYFTNDSKQYDGTDLDRIYAEWLAGRNMPPAEALTGERIEFDPDRLLINSVASFNYELPESMKQMALVGKKTAVLDQGFVQLIDLMPHPASGLTGDRAIADAARTSFGGASKGVEADAKLIRRLWKDAHSSPFEQAEMKFLIYAPLVTYWQLVRHRTFHFMSINSQSGRYTPFDEDAMYFPAEWRKQSASNKQGSDGLIENRDSDSLSEALKLHYEQSFALYQAALGSGVSKELARLFLPGFSMYYKWVVSIDVKNLMDFLRLRMAPDAQHEIRVYADAIYYDFFKPFLPAVAAAFEEFTLLPAGIVIRGDKTDV